MTSTESLDPTVAVAVSVKRFAGNNYTGAETRAREHAIASALWTVVHRGLVTAAAVLSSIAGGAILADATGGWRVVTGIIALVSAAAASAEATLKPGELAGGHKRAADGFTSLRTKWWVLKEITTTTSSDDDEIRVACEQLVQERDELSKSVPLVPRWAQRTVDRRKRRDKAESDRRKRQEAEEAAKARA
jgi:hypothetical protein